ncbi:LysR family transcriptional regulator [Robbsia andropogonis]|uniref:LysR family transcriptional regulator n=1 Tax=Robbsia andropogonis TaxID=28092 RepID=A0A0F5JW01_9BURK|nr:LysR family transcriptional regulator [Robbsia andropogonis]
MTLEQLRIFIAVAERGHLTQAAETLSLTPSAVSAALRSLEHRYDVKLFDRIGRGIALTENGKLFLTHARAAIQSAAQAEQVLTDLSGSERGRIRLRASQTIASYWLPRPLVRFRQRFPGIEVVLGVGNTQTVAQAVVEGSADVGLVEGEIDQPLLERVQFGADQLIVVVAAKHRWARARNLRVSELMQGEWVSREVGSGTRSEFEAFLEKQGVAPAALPIIMTFPSNEAVLSAVADSDFAAAVSTFAAAPALASGQIVRVPVIVAERAFSVLTHRERFRTRAVSALIAELTGIQ